MSYERPDAESRHQDAGPDAPRRTLSQVALIILDGWGLAPDGPGNAISLADTPVFDALWETHPHTKLTAKGEAVGLPEGQMGNSEVGHLNLGAGAIVPQDLARIDKAIEDGSLADNETLRAATRDAPRVHLIGLVSTGGVHSSERHLKALVELAGTWEVDDLVVHAFTDGRDTSPTSGAGSLAELEGWLEDLDPLARVGSVVGRYFAMDRDGRWDRTGKAVRLLVDGEGDHHAETGEQAVRDAYERDETDEFITPTTVGEEARIRPGDSVIAFNFRPDRMRQITRKLTETVDRYTTMTSYDEDWDFPILFPPKRPEITIAQLISDLGKRQLHVAETEKYPHVTYFFNGGEEHPFEGEIRELVPSPRDVPTYDHKPEMSAREAADAFVEHWKADQPAFAIINFANPDMVGHTGVIEAAVKAVETVDACLGEVIEAVHGSGGACVVTADHGNCDHMLNEDGSVNTAHSLNPVPFVVTAEGAGLDGEGILADVAPTVLELLGIDQPEQMTGRSLLA
jgi:2,3-bisphosphoglycerate-independent phosphoglycerate mutase